MAGVVDKDQNLRVTGGGGGGGNVTITAPLGSQPAASSVSVAIASDQVPLPVSATVNPPADIEFAKVTWSNGVGGPTTITTPGEGTLILWFHGTFAGNIAVGEQFAAAGNFAGAQGYAVPAPTITNPIQNYQHWVNQFGFFGTDFLIVIETHGIAIKLTNNISSGSVDITGTFKRNMYGTRPIFIVGQGQGYGVEVSQVNALHTSLINDNDNSVVQWTGMPSADGLTVPGGRQSFISSIIPFLFNGASFDRLRGDAANGLRNNHYAIRDVAVAVDKGNSNTGTQRVVLATDQPSIPVDPIATNNATAPFTWDSTTPIDTAVSFDIHTLEGVIFRASKTSLFSGSATIEASNDNGVTWSAIPCTLIGPIGLKPFGPGSISFPVNFNNPIQFLAINGVGYTNVRIRLDSTLNVGDSITFQPNTSTALAEFAKLIPSVMFGFDVSTGGYVTPFVRGGVLRVDPTVTGTYGPSTAFTSIPITTSSDNPALEMGASILQPEEDAAFVEGDYAQEVSETPDGRLRTLSGGLVSQYPKVYAKNLVRPLNMNMDGRLRVQVEEPKLNFPDIDNNLFFSAPNQVVASPQKAPSSDIFFGV